MKMKWGKIWNQYNLMCHCMSMWRVLYFKETYREVPLYLQWWSSTNVFSYPLLFLTIKLAFYCSKQHWKGTNCSPEYIYPKLDPFQAISSANGLLWTVSAKRFGSNKSWLSCLSCQYKHEFIFPLWFFV